MTAWTLGRRQPGATGSRRVAFVVPPFADVALALGFALLGQLDLWQLHTTINAGSTLESVPVLLVATLALAWRRRAPLACLVVMLLAVAGGGLVLDVELAFWGGLVPLLLAVFTAAHRLVGRGPFVAAGVTALGLALIGLRVPEARKTSELVFELMVFGLAWSAGFALNLRERRGALLAEQVSHHETRALQAAAEERSRIARELHDVVAHSVSVMVVQAGAARMMLDRDPEAARAALTQIEQSGRRSVEELRLLLGVLRQQDERADLAPQPTLAHLADLVARVRDAGLEVDLAVDGDVSGLPLGVELSAYRIVQEALTNSLKHAGAHRAEVRLSYVEDYLQIRVRDDGRAGASTGLPPWSRVTADGQATASGAGNGLVGMRERTALFGGELSAGPRPDGGFEVAARLPCDRGAP